MVAQGDEVGRVTVYNARLARRFRAVNYKLPISLELARCMRDSVPACSQ